MKNNLSLEFSLLISRKRLQKKSSGQHSVFSSLGFTLVELIVVITILAILGIIAFISLQGFSRDARDSARISDMKSIEKGFELLLTTDRQLPEPEDYVEITASGTVISYQGYAGQKVMGTAKVFGEGKDPLDDTYYTYLADKNFRNYQLLGFLENGEQIALDNDLLNQTQATDYSNRFPIIKGKPLGIIVDSITKEPIQVTGTGVDIVNTNTEYISYLNKNNILIGTGSELAKIGSRIENFISCKDIIDKYLYGINDGIYRIDPEGTNPFEVYCDMTTDGGGWTLVARTQPGASLGNFGWKVKRGSIDNYNDAFSMNIYEKGIEFTELIYGQRGGLNNNSWGEHIFKKEGISANFLDSHVDIYTNFSKSIINKTEWTGSSSPIMQSIIGYTNNTDMYFMRDCCGFSLNYGIKSDGIYTTYCSRYLDGTSYQHYSGPFCDGSTLGPRTNQVMLMVK